MRLPRNASSRLLSASACARFALAVSSAAVALAGSSASGAAIVKADNSDDLNLTTSWNGGVVPGAGDIGVWNSIVTSVNNVLLGANLAWSGIQITNPAGAVTIGGANTLTLGVSGIDMSTATQNLTISAPVSIAAGKQTWNVAAGRTLTLGAVPTKPVSTGGVIQFSNTGTINLGATTTNLLADAQNNAFATLGTNDWAGLNAGTVIASTYTAAPASAVANVWTTAGVVYDIQGDNTGGFTNAGQVAAALRFNSATPFNLNIATGGAGAARTLTVGGILVTANSGGGTIGGNNNAFGTIRPFRASGGAAYTLNVIQNSASDFTIGATIGNSSNSTATLVKSGPGKLILTGANTYSSGTVINEGTVQVGAGGTIGALGGGTVTNEGTLIFNRSDAITVANVIAGAGPVTKEAGGTLTLTGASTTTGNININNGTLVADLANNNVNPSSALGNPLVARNINVNTGTTLRFNQGDTLGSTTSNILAAVVVNGGTVINAGNNLTTFGPLQLNGGLLSGTGGATADFQMYNLRGTVTVGGSAASIISGSGTNAGYHLAAPTTFAVSNVTGDSATDLSVFGILADQDGGTSGFGHMGAAGGLTKTGAGTMALSGVNTYTGATTIEAGTLLVSGSISGSAVTVNNTGTLGGSGGTTGAITANTGGTLSPGLSIGILNGGALTMNGGSTFKLEINTSAVTTDLLASTGAFTLAPTNDTILTVTDLAGTPGIGGTYTFITYAPGTWNGGLFTYNGVPVLDGGPVVVGANVFTLDYNAGNNAVVLSAIPEPSALLALMGGTAVLFGVRRRVAR